MTPASGISNRVLESLVATGLMTSEQVASVLEAAASRGVHEGVILGERGFVSALDVASALEHEMGIPQVDLSSYAPEDDAHALVPAAVAREHRILPLFEIERMLTVAIGDPMDVFALDGVASEIGLEVEPVLADGISFAGVIEQYYPAGDSAAPRPMAPEPPVMEDVAASDFFEEALVEQASAPAETIEQMAAAAPAPAGPAAIDLDVLAVADARKVAVLVADILDDAVARGATRIHLLPYKDDFFLIYRVKGALERISSAPVSLQAALVDGFKQYAKLGNVPASRPALGRLRTRIADKERVLTISVVPTVAGQRLVVSIAPFKPEPRGFDELGMPEAETRAMFAMVERGRGILLVCAPVAGGSSTTYYARRAHAAAAGKTVYSVEQSIDYELPAVGQVMIEPGGPSPAAYIAAGMRQDTDVIAIDGLRTVEDVHLAIEGAGLGKLVIATFPAADIASGVRRMLDLGAEPHMHAATLTLGVGQRLVRLNCPNCSMETDRKST